MTEYRCPYCGTPSRRWYHKVTIIGRIAGTGIRTSIRDRTCEYCGELMKVRYHFIRKMVNCLSVIPLIMVGFIFVSEFETWGNIGMITFLALRGIDMILESFLGKFVKYPEHEKNDVHKSCIVDLNEAISFPKLYFCRTSVVLFEFEDYEYYIPVRIEPTKITKRHCECQGSFIGDENIEDFLGKTFIVSDNYVEIGTGKFV